MHSYYIRNVIESYFQWPQAGVLTAEATYARKDVNILRQYDPSGSNWVETDSNWM